MGPRRHHYRSDDSCRPKLPNATGEPDARDAQEQRRRREAVEEAVETANVAEGDGDGVGGDVEGGADADGDAADDGHPEAWSRRGRADCLGGHRDHRVAIAVTRDLG